MKALVTIALLLVVSLPGIAYPGEGRVATVKTLKGEALVQRGEQSLPAVVGMALFEKDRIQTAEGAALSLILLDDTTLSLGPESELDLKEYIFDPQQSRYSVVLRMLKGTFVYLSGVIGKLAPESIRLETPDSTIAVRGTRVMIKVVP